MQLPKWRKEFVEFRRQYAIYSGEPCLRKTNTTEAFPLRARLPEHDVQFGGCILVDAVESRRGFWTQIAIQRLEDAATKLFASLPPEMQQQQVKAKAEAEAEAFIATIPTFGDLGELADRSGVPVSCLSNSFLEARVPANELEAVKDMRDRQRQAVEEIIPQIVCNH